MSSPTFKLLGRRTTSDHKPNGSRRLVALSVANISGLHAKTEKVSPRCEIPMSLPDCVDEEYPPDKDNIKRGAEWRMAVLVTIE